MGINLDSDERVKDIIHCTEELKNVGFLGKLKRIVGNNENSHGEYKYKLIITNRRLYIQYNNNKGAIVNSKDYLFNQVDEFKVNASIDKENIHIKTFDGLELDLVHKVDNGVYSAISVRELCFYNK